MTTDDPNVAFKDTDYALLVGARPRGPGMERKDLLEANAAIFSVQGKAINDHASRQVKKVLVVGNPANTNALIAQRNAPDIDPRQFTAMTRLDHNRALSQLGEKLGVSINDINKITIWGNHSSTQYPDLFHAVVKGEVAINKVERDWYETSYIPTVQQRGAAIIAARGASSAASAANAAICHIRDWAPRHCGWRLGEHGRLQRWQLRHRRRPHLFVPMHLHEWPMEHLQGLDIDAFSRARMTATEKELQEERDAVKSLLPA